MRVESWRWRREHCFAPPYSHLKTEMEGGPSGGGNGTIVYFECTDCAVEAGKVPANGGKIMKDKFAIPPHGFIALAIDTEGNAIGLHSMK